MSEQSKEALSKETFQNQDLSVEVSRFPECEVHFDVTVNPNALIQLEGIATKNIKKEVSLPGFRKGKAPDKFVQEKFGSAIQKELQDLIIQFAIRGSLELSHLHQMPETQFSLLNFDLKKGEAAKLKISFEAFPTIPEINLHDIQLPKTQLKDVTEADVEEELEYVRASSATYEKLEEKEIEEGDHVQFFIESMQAPHEKLTESKMLKVEQKLPGGIYSHLLGKKAGEKILFIDSQTFEIREGSEENTVALVIEQISQQILPALDDALAKKHGADSLEDMKNKIRERRQKANEEELYYQQLSHLQSFLIQKYPFEIPKKYLEKKLEESWKKHLQSVENEKGALSAEQKRELKKHFYEHEETMIRYQSLIQSVLKKNSLEPTQEEINHELRILLSSPNALDEFFSENSNKQEIHQKIQNMAKMKKLNRFILEHAVFMD